MLLYSQKFTLTQADFYYNDTIRFSSVLDFFQTVASRHSDELGCGYHEMAQKGVAWVIMRLKFTVLAPLGCGEEITVQTYPRPKGIAGYDRDYVILDSRGNEAIIGSSLWVLMDTTTRKIIKPFYDYTGEFIERKTYDKRIEHVSPFDGGQVGLHYLVNDTDIDYNGHVNNTRYGDFIMGAKFNEHACEATFNFINELKRGDEVTVSYSTTDNGLAYVGRTGDKVVFTALVK